MTATITVMRPTTVSTTGDRVIDYTLVPTGEPVAIGVVAVTAPATADEVAAIRRRIREH